MIKEHIRVIRIFLLVLIIIGIGLIVTQKMWLPQVTNYILSFDSVK